MKLARQTGVTVLLDGQGGDEALAGYHDYYKNYFSGLLTRFHIIRLVKELILFGQIPASNPFMIFLSAIREAVPFKSNIRSIVGKNYRYAPWIKSEAGFSDLKESRCNFKSSLRKSQAVSIYYYLPGLLRYEDRNSMAHSVEARLPFLDYRLVEFAFSLPDEFKIRNAKTKAVLRDALKGYLVEEVRLRKDKMGFVTPEPLWYKTKLKDKIEDIFKTDDPVSKKYFNKQMILKLFKEFEEGKHNDFMAIWRIVNSKLWYRLLVEGK
jgi:asparagine synthase (glutamine-hydrolysing)